MALQTYVLVIRLLDIEPQDNLYRSKKCTAMPLFRYRYLQLSTDYILKLVILSGADKTNVNLFIDTTFGINLKCSPTVMK